MNNDLEPVTVLDRGSENNRDVALLKPYLSDRLNFIERVQRDQQNYTENSSKRGYGQFFSPFFSLFVYRTYHRKRSRYPVRPRSDGDRCDRFRNRLYRTDHVVFVPERMVTRGDKSQPYHRLIRGFDRDRERDRQ